MSKSIKNNNKLMLHLVTFSYSYKYLNCNQNITVVFKQAAFFIFTHTIILFHKNDLNYTTNLRSNQIKCQNVKK